MNDKHSPNPSRPTLDTLIAGQGGGALRRWRWPIVVAALAVALSAYLLLSGNGEPRGPQYRTQTAASGGLSVKVSATGKLEPTNQVDVGSELSGTVAAVFVDDDDRVTKGQVLAQLDLSKFEDAVAKARAAVGAAEAGRLQADATVKETRARIGRYREVARLSGGKVPSKTEMETAEAELARAEANLASAVAGVAQAKAALRTEETNLGKARIRSPINGVVLSRAVDPGQTVAASLQAVTLFTLAEDLTQMELKVDVDEADVGQVKAGLPASFGVDAWPGRRFSAEITRVGYNATDSDGVVSYPAVLKVANDDMSLRPGMTGTAEITTVTRDDVLLVPNAALRFTPPETAVAAPGRGNVLGSLLPRPPSAARKAVAAPVADGSHTVWVLRDGAAVPLKVSTGASDGRHTEITGGELQAGMEVITEIVGLAR